MGTIRSRLSSRQQESSTSLSNCFACNTCCWRSCAAVTPLVSINSHQTSVITIHRQQEAKPTSFLLLWKVNSNNTLSMNGKGSTLVSNNGSCPKTQQVVLSRQPLDPWQHHFPLSPCWINTSCQWTAGHIETLEGVTGVLSWSDPSCPCLWSYLPIPYSSSWARTQARRYRHFQSSDTIYLPLDTTAVHS